MRGDPPNMPRPSDRLALRSSLRDLEFAAWALAILDLWGKDFVIYLWNSNCHVRSAFEDVFDFYFFCITVAEAFNLRPTENIRKDVN